jgi:hypothetical protein
MAKRRRRRKSTAAKDPLLDGAPKPKTTKTRGLIEGDCIDGMSAPNQAVSGAVTGRNMFPLLGLQLPNEGESRTSYAFVHPRYGSYYWAHWDNAPPSWMDPVLLSDMAKKDPEIRRLLGKALSTNKKQPTQKALAKELDRVFSDEYLPFVIEEFEKVADLTAEWMILNAAEGKLREAEAKEADAKYNKRRQKKRRAKTS